MARGVNKVILVGNLGKEPEVRYTTSGSAVATITLATTESWKDKNTGEKVEKTEWHRVVFFSRLAEIVGQYLHKGSQIYVEGRLQTRKWQGQDGNDRYTTEIVANEMQMLGSKSDNVSAQAPVGGQNYQQPEQPQQPQQPQNTAPANAPAEPPMADFDDDIPF